MRRLALRLGRALGGTLGAAALLVACADGSGSGAATDNSGGIGVPQQRASEELPGDRRVLVTRVHLASNGCFLGSLPRARDSSRYLIVWPAGTEQGSSGEELRLPDGTAVRDGDVLTGAGLLMATRLLDGFGTDGYWDLTVGFCTPRATEVLVLDQTSKRDTDR